mgnify:CR=1 FL=1
MCLLWQHNKQNKKLKNKIKMLKLLKIDYIINDFKIVCLFQKMKQIILMVNC